MDQVGNNPAVARTAPTSSTVGVVLQRTRPAGAARTAAATDLRAEKRRRRCVSAWASASPRCGRRDDAGLLPRPDPLAAAASKPRASARLARRAVGEPLPRALGSGSRAARRPARGRRPRGARADSSRRAAALPSCGRARAPGTAGRSRSRGRRAAPPGSRQRTRPARTSSMPRAASTNTATQRNRAARRAAGTPRSASSSLALLRASSDGNPA